jgi:hypothetical protein
MLDQRIIFGMHNRKDFLDRNYLPFITLSNLVIRDSSKYTILGSPGILDENDYNIAVEKVGTSNEEPDSIKSGYYGSPDTRIWFPFPTRPGHWTGMTTDVHLGHIYVRKDAPNIMVSDVLDGKTYDPEDIQNIARHVNDKGALTFQFEPEQLQEFVDTFVGATIFSKEYKTNIIFSHRTEPHSKRKDGDEMICVLSFIRLDLCIPVFDFRHMNGMAVWVQVMAQGPSFGKLPNVFSMTAILTNNYKKLFEVDGENLAPSGTNSVSKSHIEDLKHITDQFSSPSKTSEKKKSKKALEDKYGTLYQQTTNSTSSGVHYYTTTTSSNFDKSR